MAVLKFFIIFLTIFTSTKGEISQEAQEIARKWMPVFWLHSEEVFMPTNFDDYIAKMELRDAEQNVVQANPTAESLLTGPDTANLHLNTRTDIECVHCYDQALFGQPVDQLRPYAVVKEWGDDCDTIDIGFKTWYPYNYGKDVCLSVDPYGFCLGVRVTFGNHFCDGDSSNIRIQNGQATQLALHVHTFGAVYEYNNETEQFDFLRGSGLNIGLNDIVLPVDYPQHVMTIDGTHPEIFVSNGSHGNWGAPGKHNYLSLVIHLDDYTDRGHEWRFWETATILDNSDFNNDNFDELYPELHLRHFQGKFGNQERLGCEIEPLFGVCSLTGCGGPPFKRAETFSAFFDPPVCP